jgi:hypothetical protein
MVSQPKFARIGALELLDRCADSVRRLPLAVAVLWLTALPSRLLLVHFVVVLEKLGSEAGDYRNALQRIANAYICTWLISLYGRQVYVRALLRDAVPPAEQEEQGFLQLLRVPFAALASHIYAAAFFEILFWVLMPTWIFPPFFALAAAVTVAAAPQKPRDLLGPITEAFKAFGSPWMLIKLSLIALLALGLANGNLFVLGQAIAWASGALTNVDPSLIGALISGENPLYGWLVFAAATLLIEPLWLGVIALQVDAGKAASTGEDLRRRFESMKSSRAA